VDSRIFLPWLRGFPCARLTLCGSCRVDGEHDAVGGHGDGSASQLTSTRCLEWNWILTIPLQLADRIQKMTREVFANFIHFSLAMQPPHALALAVAFRHFGCAMHAPSVGSMPRPVLVYARGRLAYCIAALASAQLVWARQKPYRALDSLALQKWRKQPL
jgi:hypothetical protein